MDGIIKQAAMLNADLKCVCVHCVQSPAPPAAWSSALLSHTEGLLGDMEARHMSLLLLGLGGL